MTDEEFTITPLTAPFPTLAVAPPPAYENPPSFEDATKGPETASATRPREGQDGRGEVAD